MLELKMREIDKERVGEKDTISIALNIIVAIRDGKVIKRINDSKALSKEIIF